MKINLITTNFNKVILTFLLVLVSFTSRAQLSRSEMVTLISDSIQNYYANTYNPVTHLGGKITQSLLGSVMLQHLSSDSLSLADSMSMMWAHIYGLPSYAISTTDITHWNTAYYKYPVSVSLNSDTLALTLNDGSKLYIKLTNVTVTSTSANNGVFIKGADSTGDKLMSFQNAAGQENMRLIRTTNNTIYNISDYTFQGKSNSVFSDVLELTYSGVVLYGTPVANKMEMRNSSPYISFGNNGATYEFQIKSSDDRTFRIQKAHSNGYPSSWIDLAYWDNVTGNTYMNPTVGNTIIGGTTDNGNKLQVYGNGYISGGLNIVSTTKAFNPPSMTSAQRLALIGLSPGAIVFDTDSAKHMAWDGTTWHSLY